MKPKSAAMRAAVVATLLCAAFALGFVTRKFARPAAETDLIAAHAPLVYPLGGLPLGDVMEIR